MGFLGCNPVTILDDGEVHSVRLNLHLWVQDPTGMSKLPIKNKSQSSGETYIGNNPLLHVCVCKMTKLLELFSSFIDNRFEVVIVILKTVLCLFVEDPLNKVIWMAILT